MMLCKEVSWTPLVSLPMTLGWKNTLATETFGATVMMFASEVKWVCFFLELSAVDLSSVSLSEAK